MYFCVMNKVSKKPRKKSVHKPEFLRKRELLHQKVLKLFHEENDLEEIAKKISRSKDSVYYILSKFKSELSSYPFHIYKVGKKIGNFANPDKKVFSYFWNRV